MVQANQCSDLEWSGPFKNGTPSTIRNPNVFGIRAPTVSYLMGFQEIKSNLFPGLVSSTLRQK